MFAPCLFMRHAYSCAMLIHAPCLFMRHAYSCAMLIHAPCLFMRHAYSCAMLIRAPSVFINPGVQIILQQTKRNPFIQSLNVQATDKT
jgi:hypothetical protein